LNSLTKNLSTITNETDVTYNTNISKYKLYEIIEIIDRTAFPLSYLLVTIEKN